MPDRFWFDLANSAADTHVLDCPTAYGLWNFTISSATMTGTLVARGELYRRVSVARAAS